MSSIAPIRPDEVDLLDPVVQANPYLAYDVLREQAPVWEMPQTGFYVVTSYAGLDEVIKDPGTFSIELGSMGMVSLFRTEVARKIFKEEGWVVGTKLSTDPPTHDGYRSLIDVSFTAGRVRKSEPFIRDIIEELLDRLTPSGRCEFVSDFCVPLPLRVITDRLGLPESDLGQLKIWSEAWVEPFSYAMTPDRELEVAREMVALQHYLVEWLERKRQNPQEDILSDLANGRFRGERFLTTEEMLGIAEQALVGGNETTTNAIASGLLLLLRHPEVMDALRQDRRLLKPFIEETLRLEAPTQGLLRRTTRETVLLGVPIPKGRMVHLRFGAANRDPAVFPEPERLDLTRRNAGSHMAFSQGEHHCLGAPLARQEMKLAFEMLLDRWSEIQLDVAEEELSYWPSLTLRALRTLPLRFQPRD
ncbi:MAG: cytochrome P450 [Myxococcota bacterium]|nr:cytochrome P450 [Myxococcota bacterium]